MTVGLNSASPKEAREESFTGSDYPLTRPLYLYFDAARGDLTKSFVDFCKSADGQKIVQDMGFKTLH